MNVTRIASTWRLAQSLRCVSALTPGLSRPQRSLERPIFKPPAFSSTALCSTSAATEELSRVTKHEFQAETRQLLDIVARSLYSEKEVFIRELVIIDPEPIF